MRARQATIKERDIRDGSCRGRNDLKITRKSWKSVGPGDTSRRWTQPYGAGVACRTTDGSAGVGAQGKWRHTDRERGNGAAARAARSHFRVPGIPRRTE